MILLAYDTAIEMSVELWKCRATKGFDSTKLQFVQILPRDVSLSVGVSFTLTAVRCSLRGLSSAPEQAVRRKLARSNFQLLQTFCLPSADYLLLTLCRGRYSCRLLCV